jgi:hypothetical protein
MWICVFMFVTFFELFTITIFYSHLFTLYSTVYAQGYSHLCITYLEDIDKVVLKADTSRLTISLVLSSFSIFLTACSTLV